MISSESLGLDDPDTREAYLAYQTELNQVIAYFHKDYDLLGQWLEQCFDEHDVNPIEYIRTYDTFNLKRMIELLVLDADESIQ